MILPYFRVIDEIDGPGLILIHFCPICRKKISTRIIDVSEPQRPEDHANHDVHLWLAHLTEKHGGQA
jgi:hypothetical protein